MWGGTWAQPRMLAAAGVIVGITCTHVHTHTRSRFGARPLGVIHISKICFSEVRIWMEVTPMLTSDPHAVWR